MTNKEALNLAYKLKEFCSSHDSCGDCIFCTNPNDMTFKCGFDSAEFNEPCEWGSMLSMIQLIHKEE